MADCAQANAIPTLDLSPHLAGDERGADAVAKSLANALETFGFVILTSHAFDWSLVDLAMEQSKRFFDLSDEEKRALRIGSGEVDANERIGSKGGYIAYKGLPADIATPVDMRDKNGVESLFFLAGNNPLNQWPDQLTGFREAVLRYHESLRSLAFRLLPLFARALDLRLDYFDAHFDVRSSGTLRLSHYAAARDRQDADQNWGFLPHTDGSFITLLPANPIAGLQIRPAGKDWIEAPFIPQSFVLNAGDVLARWSNGRFLSTPHRVTKPLEDRYAMPVFLSPIPSAVLAPLESCVSADRPARYDAVTMADFRTGYARRDFQYDDERLGN